MKQLKIENQLPRLCLRLEYNLNVSIRQAKKNISHITSHLNENQSTQNQMRANFLLRVQKASDLHFN